MYRNVVSEMSPDRNVPWPNRPDRSPVPFLAAPPVGDSTKKSFKRNVSTKHLRMGIEFWDLAYYTQNWSVGCIVFAVSCFDLVMIILYLLQKRR